MRRLAALLLGAMLCAACAGAWSKDATPVAADPALERRTTRLAEELRCLVCQNQSLADSHAPLALDLKEQIREQVKAGRTDEQVVGFMVERYGDFVLYRPPFKATTAFLWAGPFLILAIAIAGLFWNLRRRRGIPAERELSDADRTRAAALLAGKPADPPAEKP